VRPRYRTCDAEREAVRERLRQHLAGRPEIRFAILHGSFVEGGRFADIDVALSLERNRLQAHEAMAYEVALEAELLEGVEFPVDVRVLEHAPISFQYAATRGEPVFVRDAGALADFRERTWQAYFDFAPLRQEALRDLVGRS